MNILADIVKQKREELSTRKQKMKSSSLRDLEQFHRSPSSLRQSVQLHPVFGIIAEVKRSSPSAGTLRKNINPSAIALAYERHGAAGISVLTDECFFSGSLRDLQVVRSSVKLPVMRKDFIIDEYQVVEAKAYGADAILLIATILEKNQLSDLFQAAVEHNLECLVELYETREIDILDLDRMKLIGVNNRDLRTFAVDLKRTFTIAERLPHDITLISESGITSADDLRALSEKGIRGALIGEHFMKQEQPGEALQSMLEEFSRETSR